MLYKKDQLSGIRERLRAGKLSEEDHRLLDDLLNGAEEIASLEPAEKGGSGKRLVARLPFGMDIVK
jgi:hypothetical protein